MSLQSALSQGTIIGGHYIVGPVLNSGGFGAVYRGIDTSEGNRSCAIKETYDVTPAARRQALMEASVLLTVRSQHLPEVYDAFEFNGRFYLVMQLIEGQNLFQLLKSRVPNGIVGEAVPNQPLSGPCSEQEVLAWLLPIMDVLQELHGRKPPILHRDIKPGNLILTPQQTIVLVDFGLTKLYDPTRTTQTMIKAVSAGFSPLEQYLGKTSPQSDIYSMAVTIYLLLTNRLPSAAVTRSMSDDLVVPSLFNQFISANVERALLKALAIYADQRYRSMGEFAQDLRASAFTAYGDPTVAIVPPIIQNMQPQVAPTVVSIGQSTPPPLSSYTGVQPVPASSPKKPKSSKKKQPSQRYPTGGPVSGHGKPSQAQRMNHPQRRAQPLPNASRQGRMWGILLGIGAALIIWFLRQEGDFYLVLFVGFIAYLAAGFFTTRRGGNFFRGGSAGYLAGVTSLILFGVTLGIFLVIAFSQQLHNLTAKSDVSQLHLDVVIQSAWSAIQPAWPSLVILPNQPSFINFVAVLAAIIVLAWFLGLVGGVMGVLQNSAAVVNRQRQISRP